MKAWRALPKNALRLPWLSLIVAQSRAVFFILRLKQPPADHVTWLIVCDSSFMAAIGRRRPLPSSSKRREFSTNTDTLNSNLLVTGHPRRPIYWKAMRYFFHIFDGPKVFPDEHGNLLLSPELAIRQARVLAAELSKAGEFCRSNRVLVLDENGNNIFGCRPSDNKARRPRHTLT